MTKEEEDIANLKGYRTGYEEGYEQGYEEGVVDTIIDLRRKRK